MLVFLKNDPLSLHNAFLYLWSLFLLWSLFCLKLIKLPFFGLVLTCSMFLYPFASNPRVLYLKYKVDCSSTHSDNLHYLISVSRSWHSKWYFIWLDITYHICYCFLFAPLALFSSSTLFLPIVVLIKHFILFQCSFIP